MSLHEYCYIPSGEELLLSGQIRLPDGPIGRSRRGDGGGIFVRRFIVLQSTNIRPEDAGEYHCVVNNTAGQQTEVNITVNVQGELGALTASFPDHHNFIPG